MLSCPAGASRVRDCYEISVYSVTLVVAFVHGVVASFVASVDVLRVAVVVASVA